jgi:hypothetical protein
MTWRASSISLYFPGKDYVHQLNLITRVIGSPEEGDMAGRRRLTQRIFCIAVPSSPGLCVILPKRMFDLWPIHQTQRYLIEAVLNAD